MPNFDLEPLKRTSKHDVPAKNQYIPKKQYALEKYVVSPFKIRTMFLEYASEVKARP